MVHSRIKLTRTLHALHPTPNPLLHSIGLGALESQMRRLPHLSTDRAQLTPAAHRDFKDARKAADAAAAIGRLPGKNQALHLAVSGKFALWHIAPAVARLSNQPIDELMIATLGFSKKNITALCEMLDAGQIARVYLLCSHYFKGTSNEIYSHAETEFNRRPGRCSFLSVRNHAKLMLFRQRRGTLAVESSANLRSCRNIEQVTLIGDPHVHAFHRAWMLDLFNEAQSQTH